jgi:hypothetical protein
MNCRDSLADAADKTGVSSDKGQNGVLKPGKPLACLVMSITEKKRSRKTERRVNGARVFERSLVRE